jgi:hypothetical protein
MRLHRFGFASCLAHGCGLVVTLAGLLGTTTSAQAQVLTPGTNALAASGDPVVAGVRGVWEESYRRAFGNTGNATILYELDRAVDREGSYVVITHDGQVGELRVVQVVSSLNQHGERMSSLYGVLSGPMGSVAVAGRGVPVVERGASIPSFAVGAMIDAATLQLVETAGAGDAGSGSVGRPMETPNVKPPKPGTNTALRECLNRAREDYNTAAARAERDLADCTRDADIVTAACFIACTITAGGGPLAYFTCIGLCITNDLVANNACQRNYENALSDAHEDFMRARERCHRDHPKPKPVKNELELNLDVR